MSSKRTPSVVYWLGNRLYLNLTNRCSNNCYFCIRNFWNGVGGFNLRLEREPSAAEVISELQEVINAESWGEIVFCGFGEPTERLDCLLEVTEWIRKYYGKPVSIRVDTNGQGYLLNSGRNVVEELRAAGVDEISVSLNAHDNKTYNRVCRPRFVEAYDNVLKFIVTAKGRFDVEVTAVAIPEADISRIRDLAHRLGTGFRIREYVPGFL